jgi:hypothetical protein
MALKKSLTDPLNWLLLLLAGAFVYYIMAVPYFTDLYLKSPQQMTFQEYLASPSHPRPFMAHALSAPPPSIEIVITGLEVVHLDQDSVLLIDRSMAPATAAPAAAPASTDAATTETTGTDDGQMDEDTAATGLLPFQPELPAPGNEIMIAGDNLDLLPLSVGQTVSLQVHGLHETPNGWVPLNPSLAGSDQEELFSKDELDALELLKIHDSGNTIEVPYIPVDEMRFASSIHAAGEPTTLESLANDTTYIQTFARLAGGSVDVYDIRLTEKRFEERQPYFIVEDAEGRRAQVFFNARLLSEWYWAMDRLGGQEVVVRGTLRQFTPSQLRDMEAADNTQGVIDGYAILSRDGSVVISLENPAGSFGGPQ